MEVWGEVHRQRGEVAREGRVGWRFGERCRGTANVKMKEFELNACWL